MTANGSIDAVVIGAGVVGLAVARAFSARGWETLLVERRSRFGEETSSRNSCVVHSGIYYPTGSLKARLCVEGREALYAYCAARGIGHHRCGKLVVAQDNQLTSLTALHANAERNGVSDVRWLESDDVRALEPDVRCSAALLIPDTGVVDVHELMTALLGDVESKGGTLACNAVVRSVRPVAGKLEVTVNGGEHATAIEARLVVNSAGLDAVAVTRRIDGYPLDLVPEAYLAKGSYFACRARPFSHLVYPMPDEAGLGIHATLDLDGSVRFGPDVQWVDTIDYEVDAGRAPDFYASVRSYWPGLPDDALQPGYAGIRPKITGPNQGSADFMITGPRDHGIPGLVNLLGIESPGLTAALAIGEHVSEMAASS